MICPCKDCDARRPKCHADCVHYLAWKCELEIINARYRAAADATIEHIRGCIRVREGIRKGRKS